MVSNSAPESSEQDLLRRAQAGDHAAFQALFGRYERPLRARVARLLPRRLLRRVSVSDVVQETRIVALNRCRSFEYRGDGALRAWLLRIAVLKAHEALHMHVAPAKRAVDRETTRAGRPATGAFAAPGASPSERAIAREEEAAARRALASLPEEYRRVLQLAQLEGRSLGEVAVLLQRTRESVKKLYARAVRRFKLEYERPEDPGRA